MRFRLDPSARVIDDGTIVIGGSPLTLLRLSPAGGAAIDAIVAGAPLTPAQSRLAERLLDGGIVHPVPEQPGPIAPAHVTVVIPAYSTPAAELLGVVRAARDEGVVEVIVVDDASPAPISAPLGARLIRLEHNGGPGAARNAGAGAATTEVLVFLDADTVPEAGWLAPLLGHLSDPRVGLVAPRVTATHDDDGVLGRFEQWRSPLDLGPAPARIRAGSRVSYVPAAALLVRSEAFAAAGGFAEELRFGEDVDLVWRLDELGWRCRYEPAATVHHRTRPTLRRWLRQRYEYGTSAAPLARRHPGALAPVRVSGWSAAAWGVAAFASVPAGAAIAAGTTGALVRKLRPMQHPVREAMRLGGLGNLFAGRILAAAVTRAWWPAAFVAGCVSRRARRVVVLAAVVPALADWRTDRPRVDPLRAVALRLLDDLAYGAGVWRGVLRDREPGPLTPDLRNWPGRGTRASGTGGQA